MAARSAQARFEPGYGTLVRPASRNRTASRRRYTPAKPATHAARADPPMTTIAMPSKQSSVQLGFGAKIWSATSATIGPPTNAPKRSFHEIGATLIAQAKTNEAPDAPSRISSPRRDRPRKGMTTPSPDTRFGIGLPGRKQERRVTFPHAGPGLSVGRPGPNWKRCSPSRLL
jgi:hypothetical protein